MKKDIEDGMTEEERIEQEIASQIPESDGDDSGTAEPGDGISENKPYNPATQYLGQTLEHNIGHMRPDDDGTKDLAERKHLSRVGDNIGENAEIREGWIPVDRALLGERERFYPEGWTFYIRPATVEAIRNWSVIDDENFNSIDEVFNEIIRTCLMIKNGQSLVAWGNVNSWDRFFFLLLIREYTFKNGESNIKYDEDCPSCDNPVTFSLTSGSLMYEFPDEDIMYQFDREARTWTIDPQEYEVDADPVTLYVPTLDKDANIKNYVFGLVRENPNKKVDPVLMRFLPWMSPKVSKDETIAKRQIKAMEMTYKSWDIDMFGFMDDVVKNVTVTPSTKITSVCGVCGEEVTSQIRFPNSVGDLFNIKSKHKKFGKR